MALEHTRWAWELKLPKNEKFVLLRLADRANTHGVCWPGRKSLALDCSMHPRTVQRALHRLSELQLIRITETPGKWSRYWLNASRMLVPVEGTRHASRGGQESQGEATGLDPASESAQGGGHTPPESTKNLSFEYPNEGPTQSKGPSRTLDAGAWFRRLKERMKG